MLQRDNGERCEREPNALRAAHCYRTKSTCFREPCICQMPPRPRCASRGSSGKSKAPIQMLGRAPRGFPVPPDLQQGEQLRCKHRIAVSIIDFSVPTEILATKSLAAWRISAVREKVFCLGNLHFLVVWLFVLLVKEGALSSDHPV